jgi:hypothetical protein
MLPECEHEAIGVTGNGKRLDIMQSCSVDSCFDAKIPRVLFHNKKYTHISSISGAWASVLEYEQCHEMAWLAWTSLSQF